VLESGQTPRAGAGAGSWRTLSGPLCDESGSTRLSRYPLVVAIEGDPARQLPIQLHFSAGDSERIARDLIDLHRGAWRSREWREGPLDMKEGELRPQWL
jgi:hypothetical protein